MKTFDTKKDAVAFSHALGDRYKSGQKIEKEGKTVYAIEAEPLLTATDIIWDRDDPDIEEEIYLPDSIEIPDGKFTELEDISDYISEETGYCHLGFVVNCIYTIDEMYQRIEAIDKMLEKEYKDGETCWAANLEAEKEVLESTICIMEEQLNLNKEADDLDRE